MKKITLFALSLAVLAGCAQKENITPENNENKAVTLRFEVNYPEAEVGTKVAFGEAVGDNGPQLEWTGDETMALVFGKYGKGGADNSVMVTLPSTEKGIFVGTVTPPDGFTISDLQGFVIPAENAPRYDFRDSVNARIIMNVPQQQTQENPGEPNWTYNPFFYDLHGTEWNAEQTEFTFENLTLKSAAEMVRLNIYGKHPEMYDDEVLESVTFVSATNIASGTAEWVLGSTGTTYKNNGSKSPAVVTLTNGVTIADKSRENGVEMWMSIMGGSTKTVTSIKVVTDKAVYIKNIESQTIAGKNVTKFNVYQVGVNLANGYARYALEYSIDGGNTWVSTIPATFTALEVRGDLRAETLAKIKKAVDAQEVSVDLDLTETNYESTTFPAIFKATSAAKNTTLKSIKFPSNVTAVAADAFYWCDALESVDLSSITTIGNNAFRGTGLLTVRVDKQVTSFGTYVFADCLKLKEAYFNATDPIFKEFGNSARKNYYTFAFTNKEAVHTHDLVVTVGPDIILPRYSFNQNANLSTLIFEYNGTADKRMHNNSVVNAYYLHTVICRGTQGVIYITDSIIAVGSKLSSDVKKYIVIPDNTTEKYAKLMNSGVAEEEGWAYNGFTLIEQSAYDAL